MDHSQAAEHHLVEQYLLNELSPELRDEFEEHFFDCQDCAAELRATSAFLETARDELRKMGPATSSEAPAVPPRATNVRSFPRWRPVFALAALAACLIVLVYQNTVVFPRLRSEVASLDAPELLPSISLVGGNSRGGSLPSATLNGAHSLLLQVDIPSQERFASYACSLYSPEHQLISTVQVSAQAAKDTVSLRVPLGSKVGGTYSLEVRGHEIQDASSPDSGAELATYRFTLNAGAAGEGH